MERIPTEAAEGSGILREWQELPRGLLERPAEELVSALGGPALFHLPGRSEPPLFVSVLLHGNETSGWEAVRRLLARYGEDPLPRALSLFVGNVAAAAQDRRFLSGQPDYNRIWRGSGTPEHAMAAQVRQRMARRGLFASIDIHNNSGRNPHYACINRLERPFLQLAARFAPTVVYFTRPDTAQSNAFAELAPSVTVECGCPGDPAGIDRALQFLEKVLTLSGLPDEPVPSADYDLFHTVARVEIPPGVDFELEESGTESDLVLRPDLQRLNFAEMLAGTPIGRIRLPAGGVEELLDARDENGEQVTGRYFTLDGDRIRTRLPVMPCMLTPDPAIIRQDCLCYLMERLPPLD